MFRKWQYLRKHSEGFTLVELMIVVAIIAILAAIAIPQYKKFQYKAKQSEVYENFNALKTCEESFFAEHDSYVSAGPAPGAAGTATMSKRPWVDGTDNNGYMDGDNAGDFSELGFQPTGGVYANYEITAGASDKAANPDVTGGNFQDYTISAETDLDGDSHFCYYVFTPDADNDGKYITPSTIGSVPTQSNKIQKQGDDF